MRVTDPRAMRALAHPVRLDLLDLLGRLGSATAATCARALGTSQASCSFHLRQLAKYGFVVEAEPSGDQRERPWRLVDLKQEWSRTEGGAAADELARVFLEREAVRMLDWIETGKNAPEEWRKAAFTSGVTAPMTAQELADVSKALMKLLEPYAQRFIDGGPVPENARFVRIFLHGSPAPDFAGCSDADPSDAGMP